ncbi:MAG: HmuY family protein [Bacteroidales bacterium]
MKSIFLGVLPLLALVFMACSKDEKVDIKDYGVKTFSGDLGYDVEIANNATHGDGSIAYTQQVYFAFGNDNAVASYKVSDATNWTNFNLVEGKYNVSPKPTLDDWNLIMTYYIDPIQMGEIIYEYGVTGVLINQEKVAGVAKVEYTGDSTAAYFANNIITSSFDTVTYTNDVSVIGRAWKSADMTTSMYTVKDNWFYAVKLKDGSVYKMRFTGFHGATANDRIVQFEYALMEE